MTTVDVKGLTGTLVHYERLNRSWAGLYSQCYSW